MIRSQMCHVFLEQWHEAIDRRQARVLPSQFEILKKASLHPGISPYLAILDLVSTRDSEIVRFPPAWQTWWQMDMPPRLLSEFLPSERVTGFLRAILQAVEHPCGLHEIGVFYLPNEAKDYPTESVYLPLASGPNAPPSVAGFAVLLNPVDDTAKTAGFSVRSWLDIGFGIPDAPPPERSPRT